MEYRTLWVVRHVMPEGRLAYGKIAVEDDDLGLITIGLRYGAVGTTLARSMAQFSKRFAETGAFEIEPWRDGERPEIQAWFERVEDRFTGGEAMQVHAGGTGPLFFEVLAHEALIDPAVIRELNEEVMPGVCSVLVPVRVAD